MLRLGLSVLGLALVACTSPQPEPTSASDTKLEPPSETGVEPPNDPPSTAWVEPVRTHLLVHGHANEDATARVLPIALTETPASSTSGPSTRASGPTLGTTRALPAAPAPNWPGHFVSKVSHAGGTTFVAVAGGPELWTLEVVDLEDPGVRRSIPIGAVLPMETFMAGDQVFLGQADTVGWIDVSAAAPTWVELHRRPEMKFKAYDLFVRSGDWLIAIDDQVSPIWADGFRLSALKPAHIQDHTMPSAINGMYYAGNLVATGPDDGMLYLLLHYGIMTGHGHDLAALPIRDGKLEVPPDTLINGGGGGPAGVAVLEEHVDRGSGLPEQLCVGTEYSEWTSLEYLPAVTGGKPRLLISAVARGLLELPTDFGPQTKANVIDLGGDVMDAIVVGTRVFVLVNVQQPVVRSELVELAMLPVGASVERRTGLPEVFHRFVR